MIWIVAARLRGDVLGLKTPMVVIASTAQGAVEKYEHSVIRGGAVAGYFVAEIDTARSRVLVPLDEMVAAIRDNKVTEQEQRS